MKTAKKILIVIVIMAIKGLFKLYKIISKFCLKYKGSVKNFLIKLDKELRAELWKTDMKLEN